MRVMILHRVRATLYRTEYPTAHDLAAELPDIWVAHVETPTAYSEGGFKGAGEGGVAGAPGAVLNAVNDALSPFGARITSSRSRRPLGNPFESSGFVVNGVFVLKVSMSGNKRPVSASLCATKRRSLFLSVISAAR